VKIASDRAIMSAFRPTADAEAVMARFYNPDNEAATVSLQGIFRQVVRCDAISAEPLDDEDASKLQLRAGEIATVRLS
jgi:alpha-mannosidase